MKTEKPNKSHDSLDSSAFRENWTSQKKLIALKITNIMALTLALLFHSKAQREVQKGVIE
jgi:hypothetical protein